MNLADLPSYGYIGIAVFLILTGCGLPLPEEVAIITAGVLAANGKLDPWLALAACLVGAVAGDSVPYFFGRQFGSAISKKKSAFWTRVFNPKREKQMERLLKEHGIKMLFLNRFLIGIRSPLYFAAGMLQVNYLWFLMADSLCAGIVIGMFFGLTYFFGKGIWGWIHHAEVAITVAVVVAIIAVIVIYWLHRRSKAMLAEAEAADDASEAAAQTEAEVGTREG